MILCDQGNTTEFQSGAELTAWLHTLDAGAGATVSVATTTDTVVDVAITCDNSVVIPYVIYGTDSVGRKFSIPFTSDCLSVVEVIHPSYSIQACGDVVELRTARCIDLLTIEGFEPSLDLMAVFRHGNSEEAFGVSSDGDGKVEIDFAGRDLQRHFEMIGYIGTFQFFKEDDTVALIANKYTSVAVSTYAG